MQNLEKRITALEAANPTYNALTIIRRVVAPGQLDAEITRLRDGDGNHWMRQTGETEQALIDRASFEVRRNPWGVASLHGTT